jgi:hypothetical protein
MPVRVGIRHKAASNGTAAHWLFGDSFVFLTHVAIPCVGNSAHSVAELETDPPGQGGKILAGRGLPASPRVAQESAYKNLDSGTKRGRIRQVCFDTTAYSVLGPLPLTGCGSFCLDHSPSVRSEKARFFFAHNTNGHLAVAIRNFKLGHYRAALLVLGGFPHDAQRILTAVQRFALVRVELGLETGGRFFKAANIGCFELLAAMGANGNTGRCTDVLHDPNSSLWHDSVSHSPSPSASPVEIKWHHYPLFFAAFASPSRPLRLKAFAPEIRALLALLIHIPVTIFPYIGRLSTCTHFRSLAT